MTTDTAYCWLIEHKASSPAVPMYLSGQGDGDVWQDDARLARRFPSESKAKVYAYLLNDLSTCRVAEHAFDETGR